MTRDFIHGLLEINCKYHYKVGKDKKCYSSKCMMNQNKEIKQKIKEDGCLFYKHNPKIQE